MCKCSQRHLNPGAFVTPSRDCSHKNRHKSRAATTDTRGQQSAAVSAGLGGSFHSQKLHAAVKHTLAEDYYWMAMIQFDSLTCVRLGCRARHSQMSFKAILPLKGYSLRAFRPFAKGRFKCLLVSGHASMSSSEAAGSAHPGLRLVKPCGASLTGSQVGVCSPKRNFRSHF